MARTILHLDLDAFFCAVEELHDPTLSGKAFAVGGRPESRGVVASCSYPARLCRRALGHAHVARVAPLSGTACDSTQVPGIFSPIAARDGPIEPAFSSCGASLDR